ncbi:MAG: Mu transposase C-terminal domain-containing protein [Candidatus Sulfopaludibacter sp.]|nr:Mu transposase C-terminal domain-containing protein [Candidatus Sulfopaludibacter sp.]
MHHAIVKNARAKLIEPNFSRIADFDRTLPEWCGHKPGARPERFDKMLQDHEVWLAGKLSAPPFRTIEDVATLYTKVLEDLNERELQGEGMRKVTYNGMGWMCPNEAWELTIGKVERRSVPEEVLQLCFAKRRELTVRNGEVQVTFADRPYHYRLLGNRTALLGFNDRKVEIAYDPLDLGRVAIYFDNRFLGLADCVALRRMGEDAFVQDERDRRTARREVKRFINAVHQAVPVPDAETYLARRRAVAPERPEVARVEIPMQLPAPIAEAHAAVVADAQFSFDAVTAELPVIETGERSDADTEFNFFSDQGD